MSPNLVRLPSISDLTTLLNNQNPIVLPPKSQMWFPNTAGIPQKIYSPPATGRFYPLQLVLLAETIQNAPRTMTDGFRFAKPPGRQRQRQKKPRLENKERVLTSHRHETAALIINDPTVNFPIAIPDLPPNVIPPEELHLLKTSIYPSIVTKKYTALALDPLKSHLMVYEYGVGAHWVIWDHDTGYVHLTGLWRAALQERALQKNSDGVVHVKSNSKADIVKLLELTPKSLHPFIKRVRGGFLKIQGTWVPFHLCRKLALRFCFYIRYKLVPIFGPDFPSQCLRPSDAGFGVLRFDDSPSHLLLPQLSPRLNSSTQPALFNKSFNQANQMAPAHYGQHQSLSQPYEFNERYDGNHNYKFRETTQKHLSFPNRYHPQAQGDLNFGNGHLQRVDGISIPVPGHAFTQAADSLSHQRPLPLPMQIPSQNRSLSHFATAPSMLAALALNQSATEVIRLPPSQYADVKPKAIVDQSAMTFTDMVDLVNASKCLQSLSQRESTSLELLTYLDKMRIDHILS